MKKQVIKFLAVIICMLAAGICYSCDNTVTGLTGDGQKVVLETESAPEAETKPAETPACYYVHICGEVNAPGVYEMEAGSRIFQAVEMAGGFTDTAAAEYLNMAQEVTDGMKLLVPSVEDVESGQLSGLDELLPASGEQKVNLNTATKEQLMTLRGIGESRAEDIIRYREETGPFRTIEEIMEISGIKDAAFQKIKEDITV